MAIKEPKTFKRPRLYYQDASGEMRAELWFRSPRMRIIWPNGKSQIFFAGSWRKACWASGLSVIDDGDDLEPCGKSKSGDHALRQMRRYDRHYNWPRAEFICEL